MATSESECGSKMSVSRKLSGSSYGTIPPHNSILIPVPSEAETGNIKLAHKMKRPHPKRGFSQIHLRHCQLRADRKFTSPFGSSHRAEQKTSPLAKPVLKNYIRSVEDVVSKSSKGSQTSTPLCRVCYESERSEPLLAPCHCSGTMGSIHRSCLEKWLGTLGHDSCEICHKRFVTERRPKPIFEFFREPSSPREFWTLCGDLICFLLVTPLSVISVWLCMKGAAQFSRNGSHKLEVLGLTSLSTFLLIIYIIWCLVAFRYHRKVLVEWQRRNQVVRFLGVIDQQSEEDLTNEQPDDADDAAGAHEDSPTYSLHHIGSQPFLLPLEPCRTCSVHRKGISRSDTALMKNLTATRI